MRAYVNLPKQVEVDQVILFNDNKNLAFIIPKHTRPLTVETSKDAYRSTNCSHCPHYKTVKEIRQELIDKSIAVTSTSVQQYIADNKLCLASDNDISCDIPCHAGLLYEELVEIPDVVIPRCLAVSGKKGIKSSFYLGVLADEDDEITSDTELLRLDIGNVDNDLSLCLSSNSKDFTKSELGTALDVYFSCPFNNSLSAPGVDLESVIRSENIINSSISVPLSNIVNTETITRLTLNQPYLPDHDLIGVLVSDEEFDLVQHNVDDGSILQMEALNTIANILQYVNEDGTISFYERASLTNSRMNSKLLFVFNV